MLSHVPRLKGGEGKKGAINYYLSISLRRLIPLLPITRHFYLYSSNSRSAILTHLILYYLGAINLPCRLGVRAYEISYKREL